MELYYGARDKAELNKLEKFVSLFEIIHLNETISSHATQLIKTYAKSHTLDIPDGLIAATALVLKVALLTYNTKDFKYIKDIELLWAATLLNENSFLDLRALLPTPNPITK